MTFLISLAALLVVLGVLIFVHEAGHFIAAKAAGIWVHRFSLGLGSPIRWLTWKRGETEYSVSWLPLGGYVKMASREEDSASGVLEGGPAGDAVPPDRVFEAKPVWVRIVVILAGVTMNILFAWAAYVTIAAVNGEQILPTVRVGGVTTAGLPEEIQPVEALAPGDSIVAINGEQVSNWNEVLDGLVNARGDGVTISVAGKPDVKVPVHIAALEERAALSVAVQPWMAPVIGLVQPGTPADRAELAPGDTVISVNGEAVAQWYDMVDRIRPHPGEELTLVVGSAEGRETLTLIPEAVEDTAADGSVTEIGQVGIGLQRPIEYRDLSLGAAFVAGTEATLGASTLIIRTLRGMLTNRVSGRSLGGPILIAQLAGQTAQLGWDSFLGFMALISVNLAILNLLPIPVLDGGQFLFLVAEGVRGRPLSLRLRERLTAVGLVMIILLMVFAFSNDILRLFGV
ncbi:MAG: RIP metalloprotease RseP [Gemmatimonadales bacterium]